MRPMIVAGNWKMNTTPADAGELASAIARATAEPAVERVICPPFVALAAVRDALAGTGVAVGAQDVHPDAAGAFTGGVSAAMLDGLATWSIIGHSERRRDMCEDDILIGRKLARCADSHLRPILCVGEHLDAREAGMADEVVRAQLRSAFAMLDARQVEALCRDDGQGGSRLVIAYEPVWAIGTGRTARGSDAGAMADEIRAIAAESLGRVGAARLPVLYGGSVTSSVIAEFLAEPSIDGALVGGASLKVDEMAGIVARAAVTARARAAAATS